MDDVEKNQVELNKSYEHLSTVKKHLNFYELRQDVINVFKDYYKMINNAIYDAKCGEGPKILTPKKCFKDLTAVFAEVKADNTCKNLLNEIRKIIYFLY